MKRLRLLLVLTGLAAAAGLFLWWYPPPPDVPFAPYGDDYGDKPDFAWVEHDHPLSVDDRRRITPRNVAKLPQEKVDQVYARLTAGPIPDGLYQGHFFFARGGGVQRISEILGGVKGFAADLELRRLKALGEALWKGKVFYRDQRVLRNVIRDEELVGRIFGVETVELRRETVGGREVALLFPAKLYCGQSLLDSRRESIVVDYGFNDDIDGYVDEIDFLAGRNGMKIRDEIRRVRPGFYLGRAYVGRVFLLNFTLYSEEAATRDGLTSESGDGTGVEDCWIGSQL